MSRMHGASRRRGRSHLPLPGKASPAGWMKCCLFRAASYRSLLGRMGIHGARSKAAFRKALDERARESPGEPGRGSGCGSSLLRKGQSPAQQLAGFRIGAAGLESLVEITGRSDRQRPEETNEHGVGLDDFVQCGIKRHGQSPRARTIGRLRIQPEMQHATRTSVMRCLQKKRGGNLPGERGRCPRTGMRCQAMTSNDASPFFAGSGSVRLRR